MAYSLVVSDVDGTLVTSGKTLAPSSVAAVRRLEERGIAFTIASSRPPIGLRSIARDLGLTLPMGAFNGSTLVDPALGEILSETLIPEAAAREAVAALVAAAVDIWVFADGEWLLRDPQAAYTDVERRTLRSEPSVTADLAPFLGRAAKIVGVSGDFAHLASCEERIGALLGERATVHRSQRYYLDVTPPGVDKGSFIDAIAKRLGIANDRIASLGDAANDVAMFARSGLGIAMGNATDAVKAAAGAVTGTNDADGFAAAIDRYVLA